MNGVAISAIPCGEETVGYEEEDDGEDESDGDLSLSLECDSNKPIPCIVHLPSMAEVPVSTISGSEPGKDSTSPTFCRLEPITSLFHSNSQEVSGSSAEEVSTRVTSVSPNRPPSVCEVATA